MTLPLEKHSEEYLAYLKSDHWKTLRDKVFGIYNRWCSVCGETEFLQVHHFTYIRLGNELWGDLAPVCKDCHEILDGRRELARELYCGRCGEYFYGDKEVMMLKGACPQCRFEHTETS